MAVTDSGEEGDGSRESAVGVSGESLGGVLATAFDAEPNGEVDALEVEMRVIGINSFRLRGHKSGW